MKAISLILLILVVCLAKEHPEAKLYFTDYCRYFKYPVMLQLRMGISSERSGSKRRELKLRRVLSRFSFSMVLSVLLILESSTMRTKLLPFAGQCWIRCLAGQQPRKQAFKKICETEPRQSKEFWEFTFQHMADYDFPVVFTYIHDITEQKIHYLGHSQGTIHMHIALAKRNSVVENLMDKYFGFGPVAYVSYQISPIISLLDKSLLLQWYNL